MMQPNSPLSQLAMCCGLGPRRRDYKPRYFYSPSTAHLDPASGWSMPMPNPYMSQAAAAAAQPYILLSQPVILGSEPMTNQSNTMTLVQSAHSATSTAPFPALTLIGAPQVSPQRAMRIGMMSSQYAIYSNSTSGPKVATHNNLMGTNYELAQPQSEPAQSLYLRSSSPGVAMMEAASSQRHQEPKVTLNSEMFRQLEEIEKQVDLSADMEVVEKHGIVLTRALDPNSLVPHLTDATLRRYHENFLMNDNYVIRFIEVIKRPGQTLGLYIRTVKFEDSRSRNPRDGLVITKIDSDSPVYNSQVLHVGDEIISVNLVDIRGMSLDDVVIIMSIPKRLVLALRIPRERDQLLSLNLMQQQHHQQQLRMLREPFERRENSSVYEPSNQIESLRSDFVPRQTSSLPIRSHNPSRLFNEVAQF